MTNCYWADLQSISPFRSQDRLAAQEKSVDITLKCLRHSNQSLLFNAMYFGIATERNLSYL